MREISLYYSVNCPFCVKVLNYMDENDIIVNMKNISENSMLRVELQEKSLKTQVPCLMIDGEPMWESDDIIQWMKDNLE